MDSLRSKGSGVREIEIGGTEDGPVEHWDVTLFDAATRSPVLHLRLATSVIGASLKCIFEKDRAIVAADCTVVSVDLRAMEQAWERTLMTPLMDCWITAHGLLVVGEGALALLDAAGRSIWERSTGDLVVDFERTPPLLRLTLDSGDVLEIDETTGAG